MLSPLTLDKLKDKRFLETEKAIFRSVTEGKAEKIEDVMVAAKISRATFYRHHRAVHLIERDYEDLVEEWVRELMRNEEDLRKMYFQMLLFVYKNREVFQYFLMRENVRAYLVLMREMRLAILGVWQTARWMEPVYEIYAGEVIGVLIRWGRGGYEKETMTRVLDNIMYLTETAKERLTRFVEQPVVKK